MGEFWARDTLLTGNCRFAASVAHVWGHRFVASESFTTAETGRWTRDPFAYKAQGDRAFCAGINRIIYHRWAHQPWTNPENYPGMTMGPHGSHFERTQTWWADAAAAWLTYQARCQWMLQQGVAASDLLVVAEDRTPSCGLDLSRWHEYESVDPDRTAHVHDLASVAQGRTTSPLRSPRPRCPTQIAVTMPARRMVPEEPCARAVQGPSGLAVVRNRPQGQVPSADLGRGQDDGS